MSLTASLEVIALFVAGMTSVPDICTKILTAAGAAQASVIRDERRAHIKAVRERSAAQQQETPIFKVQHLY